MKCRLMKSSSISFSRYFLYALCCLLLCLVSGSSPANAYSYDIENAGKYKFLPSASRFYNRDGGNASLTSTVGGLTYYPDAVYLTTGGVLDYVVLALDTNIPKGSLLSFVIAYSEIGSSSANRISVIQPHEGFGQFVVMDYEPVTGSHYYYSSGSDSKLFGDTPEFVKVTIMTTEPLNAFAIDMSWEPTSTARTLGFFPQTYIQLKDSSQVTIDAIDNASDQAHKDSQAQQEAINNQTKQEKDQYDQEKQEEQEREESAKNEGNSLLGIFNITILNPFAGIWEMFNSGGCTSIPTITSWTGSKDTTYCSWWPQSIRATLTPVFSLASMMLLFGFVSRWLGGSASFHIGGD